MELQLWKEILGPYRQAVDELLVKFNHIIEDHHNAGLYSPIEQVKGRVKSISSILENRKPAVHEILSANITATGICAHKSAMNGGKIEVVPEF
jgi:ppGpp synthetase/RelA/SpoT-type nucleotidyltranferase